MSKEERQKEDKDKYSVIMTINYPYKKEYEPSIYKVKDLSYFPNEEEHILLPFTFLKLSKINIDSDNYIADIDLEVIGKREILENKIKESKLIDYDKNSNVMKILNE